MEPGVYFYTYQFTDLTQSSGCVMVTPKNKEHVVEVTADGFKPGTFLVLFAFVLMFH